jgi:hypothetical protein
MRDAIELITKLRQGVFTGADKALAVEELKLQTSPTNEMRNTAIAVYSGQEVEQFYLGRFEAWIDEHIHRTYPRLPDSNLAVAQVGQRKPYPWEVKR